jgi:hypothetical protein
VDLSALDDLDAAYVFHQAESFLIAFAKLPAYIKYS